MKKFNKLSYFLSGVLCATLVLSLASPAFAEGVQKTISIATGVNIFVDDVKLNPTDGNGKPVEAFIYDGTTYLPVRAVSQALGKNVLWDGATGSVFLGQHKADGHPVCPLEDLEYFTSEGMNDPGKGSVQDNLGETHTSMIFSGSLKRNNANEMSVIYKLNGKYSAFSGTFFLSFDKRNVSYHHTLKIYGDNKLLWNGTVSGGLEPVDFNVDLTGVLELKLEFVNDDSYGWVNAYLGDTMLYT